MAACFKWDSARHRYRIPSHHVLLIESGRIDAKTPVGTFTAKEGDLICFRPADWNEYGTCGVARIYEAHLEFAPPPKHRLTPNLDEFGPLPVHVPLGGAFDEMRRVFEIICLEISREGALHRLRIRAAVHEMLAIIVSVLTRDENGSLKHLDAWQRLRLQLDSEVQAECNVGRLARQMGLSRPYFSRAFKQRFGLTPQAYHTHARLREAARLLRSTDIPIKEIAFEFGFGDAKFFTRLFKRHLGVLPSDIRLGNEPRPKEAASEIGYLFPTNKHLLPPRSGPNWRMRYFPRRRGKDYVMTLWGKQKRIRIEDDEDY